MRDSPDLKLRKDDFVLFAEVKRVREKEKDRADDLRLEEAGRQGRLVSYGGPVEDGRSAWDQVVDVTRRKCSQYSLNAPLLLIIRSDSGHCIEEDEVMTAANIINEQIWKGDGAEFDKLGGILFFARWESISQHRGAHFYRICGRSAELPASVVDALKEVRKRYVLP